MQQENMKNRNIMNTNNKSINNKDIKTKEKKPELGIYIHIPFCIKKCYYCDFISFSDKFDIQNKYIEKIKEEIQAQKHIMEKYDITTIYIGGGTPSSIESKKIIEILEEILNKDKNVKVNNKEITIEVNPGTVTKQKLEDYKEAGINRISIGLQTTNNKLLKNIGRIHNLEDFEKTYNLIKEIGFKNINVDLMIGLPNQTIEDIKQSIEKIVNLTPKPKHISVYSLIIEENTPFEKMLEENKLSLPSDEEERTQYHYVKNKLELEGYKHYEISNFAILGFESIHNSNCWEQKEYLGIGLAAHSYINKVRVENTSNIEEYLKLTKEKIQEESKKIQDIAKQNYTQIEMPVKIGIKTINEVQSKSDQEKEYMLLGLRKLDGVEILKFKQKFNENPIYLFREELSKLFKEELIEIDLDQIKLTRKGLDLANLVWEEFID